MIRVELSKLLRNRRTWVTIALIDALPALVAVLLAVTQVRRLRSSFESSTRIMSRTGPTRQWSRPARCPRGGVARWRAW